MHLDVSGAEEPEQFENIPPLQRTPEDDLDEYRPIVQVISDDFPMPQLGSTRRITALLPYNYDETEAYYPVLYLQDGQNLFDDHAPFGNWAIDDQLAFLARQGMGDIIVIAIDHGEDERLMEYNPFFISKVGMGSGRKYVKFMVETLKPFVDRNFRTKSRREFTAIGGSSMGGLISMWTGIRRPAIFGKIMVFSPSFWISPLVNFHARNYLPPNHTRIYFYAGGKESMQMVPHVRKFYHILESRKHEGSDIHLYLAINPQGEHKEAHWKDEFPRALAWLFYDQII